MGNNTSGQTYDFDQQFQILDATYAPQGLYKLKSRLNNRHYTGRKLTCSDADDVFEIDATATEKINNPSPFVTRLLQVESHQQETFCSTQTVFHFLFDQSPWTLADELSQRSEARRSFQHYEVDNMIIRISKGIKYLHNLSGQHAYISSHAIAWPTHADQSIKLIDSWALNNKKPTGGPKSLCLTDGEDTEQQQSHLSDNLYAIGLLALQMLGANLFWPNNRQQIEQAIDRLSSNPLLAMKLKMLCHWDPRKRLQIYQLIEKIDTMSTIETANKATPRNSRIVKPNNLTHRFNNLLPSTNLFAQGGLSRGQMTRQKSAILCIPTQSPINANYAHPFKKIRNPKYLQTIPTESNSVSPNQPQLQQFNGNQTILRSQHSNPNALKQGHLAGNVSIQSLPHQIKLRNNHTNNVSIRPSAVNSSKLGNVANNPSQAINQRVILPDEPEATQNQSFRNPFHETKICHESYELDSKESVSQSVQKKNGVPILNISDQGAPTHPLLKNHVTVNQANNHNLCSPLGTISLKMTQKSQSPDKLELQLSKPSETARTQPTDRSNNYQSIFTSAEFYNKISISPTVYKTDQQVFNHNEVISSEGKKQGILSAQVQEVSHSPERRFFGSRAQSFEVYVSESDSQATDARNQPINYRADTVIEEQPHKQYSYDRQIELIKDRLLTPPDRQLEQGIVAIPEESDSANSMGLEEDREPVIEEDRQYVVEEYQNGSRYQGYKSKGFRNGRGKFYYQQGSFYDGQWKKNNMHGYGRLYYSNQRLAYEGEWYKDQFHGKGRVYNDDPTPCSVEFDYTNFDNLEEKWDYYEGTLVSDSKEGHGKLVLSNGEYYDGEFQNDSIHGKGKFYTLSGEVIHGIWRNSELQKIEKRQMIL